MTDRRFRRGMLLFPNLIQPALTTPYEIPARLPDAVTPPG
jgi:hypothetical protein